MELNIDAELQKVSITCTAIICITAIVLFAVEHGHDGLFIGGGSATIAGLAGYKLKAINT